LKTITKNSRPIPLENAVQVRIFLSKLINGVMRAEIEPGTATKIGYLAGVLLKAIEVSEIENRLNELEIQAEEFQRLNE
jgi:hypothetical protein